MWRSALLLFAPVPLLAQYSADNRPRFEEFPADELFHGPNAPVQLTSSSERMFKTRLTEASKLPPNVAGHLRFVDWGCGQYCGAGAFVDLKSGRVIQPPHAGGSVGWDRWIFKEGFFLNPFPVFEHRDDSPLFILRVGMAKAKPFEDGPPNTYYFLWEANRFRLLLQIPADRK